MSTYLDTIADRRTLVRRLVAEIVPAIRERNEGVGYYATYAVRIITTDDTDLAPSAGDYLRNSYRWDGDEPSGDPDDELPGTCATTLADAERESPHYWGTHALIISGEPVGSGDDAGEVWIRRARVEHVISWPA